jgi:hypothetical protein
MVLDGKPAFVLVGPQGGIRYYVTPSAGVDFSKYVDQLVAVKGPVTYRVEVRAQHIVVRDIVTIEIGRNDPQ